ncbi:unnamed protein product, partial [marine sediment metagenome]
RKDYFAGSSNGFINGWVVFRIDVLYNTEYSPFYVYSPYFSGSFPSACGKTSTCMLEGETVVGDDIAYLRKIDGKIRAVNVERGIFGIIKNVNSKDDPSIYEAIATPGEIIFSNVLVTDENQPYWI